MAERKAKEQLAPLAAHLAADDRRWWGSQRPLLTLTSRWPALVGRVFAEHSTPAFFRRNELWIYTSGPVWMQQMNFSKLEILARINELLQGELRVDELRWTLPPADFALAAKQEETSPPTAVDSAAEQAFLAMTEAVADPEARAALRRLWLRLAAARRPES
jgi:hypothetical protein